MLEPATATPPMAPNTAVAALLVDPPPAHRPMLAVVRAGDGTLECGAADWLHPIEQDYLATLGVARRRHSYLLGRSAAHAALQATLGPAEARGVAVDRGVFTQPVLRATHDHNLDVSITHSGECGAALVFPRAFPMGLDLECLEGVRSATIERQLTEREHTLIAEAAGPLGHLGRLAAVWSAKEALSKALRCGLTCPMQVMAIKAFETSDNACTGLFENFFQYRFHTAETGDGHVVAVVLHRDHHLDLVGAL